MKYALIIGNDKYIDEKLPQLITPAEDARELAKVLSDRMIGEFDEVEQVINKTTSEIRKTISKFLPISSTMILCCCTFLGMGFWIVKGA